MTDQHPIAPPPELVQQWWDEVARRQYGSVEADEHIAEQAAQWGADQELEACCKWLDFYAAASEAKDLRAARRPKPPNLKAQALAALSRADKDALTNPLTGEVVALRTILSKEQSNTIRRALEQLDD